jgi:hypothetical protein
MTAIIFAGPSLPPRLRPALAGIEWRPPVRQGDLYLAALQRPALIGVIDGYFERVPTVWHKEILWAMAEGIHVYGAASTGALRAAELADFGMKGVGRIYQQFHDGELTDDDEVAVLHGPPEVGYVQLTEPMVDVRVTIERAVEHGVITSELAAPLVGIAKSLFYKERTYETILAAAAGRGLGQAALDRFATWLPDGRVGQKRIDAEEMLAAMREHLERGVTPFDATYRFVHTFAWEDARRRSEAVRDEDAKARP